MIAAYAFLFVFLWVGLKPRFGGFHEDYLSCEQTGAIKGIFVLTVFFSHFKQYVDLSGPWYNVYFGAISGWIGQLMVVMFLFYSGYGIMMQIRKQNEGGYIRSFLLHRFLPVWLQFAICVLLFFVVNCITGKLAEYSCQQILLSFTGWTAIGNSNWFMFVTFALYLAVYCSFRIFPKKSDTFHLIVLTGFSLALLAILYFSKESYWWNTLLCFPLGMWYSHFQKRIDSFMGVAKRYWATALPLFSVFILLWFINIRVRSLGKGYIVLAMLFALCVVSLTMKVKIGNRVLGFFGKHVFSIYILQRIPMMILQPFISNIYLYFLVCFAVTVGMAVGFDYLFGKGWAAIKRINCAAKQ